MHNTSQPPTSLPFPAFSLKMLSAKDSTDCQGEADLPVLDLSALQSHPGDEHPEIQRLRSQIGEACKQWGCFRVINHGVDEELIRRVDSVSRSFFNLPTEIKERVSSSREFDGYYTKSFFSRCESMSFFDITALQQYTQKLWPEGDPQFCETLRKYIYKVADLRNSILKLMIESLGLDADKHFPSNFAGNFRLNYYSGDGDGDTLHFSAHRDIVILSILLEDEVGGLEVRSKQGEWLSVRPLPASFLIIIGDAFKIWSNDRSWSVEHRVVYGGGTPRLSVILFWNFPREEEVKAPKELIDDQHPQRYKPYVPKDYLEAYVRARGTPPDISI